MKKIFLSLLVSASAFGQVAYDTLIFGYNGSGVFTPYYVSAPASGANRGIQVFDPNIGQLRILDEGIGIIVDPGAGTVKLDVGLFGAVAFSNDFADLSNVPAFATAAQGTTADSAVQPAAMTSALASYATTSAMTSALASYATSAAVTSAMAGKMNTNPGGTSGQYVKGDGTFGTYSPGTGTVTSVTAGAGLSGGAITTSGTVSMPNVGSAGTYSGVTTDAQGRVSSGTTRSFNNAATKTLVTSPTAQGGVILDASRDVQASYWVDTSITTNIGGTSTATVFLEIASTNSATAGDWTTLSKASNGQTITLALALQSVQPQTVTLNAVIPAGQYVRLRSSTAGTASVTYGGGQEVKL